MAKFMIVDHYVSFLEKDITLVLLLYLHGNKQSIERGTNIFALKWE